MTVCISVLFRWNYSLEKDKLDVGMAALTASDRKITAGDVEYEPQQLKVAFITPRILVMIAGDYSLHSQAIADTHKQVRNNINATPENVARIYGYSLQVLKRRQAEDLYLAPFGMNTDSFISQQRELSEHFVERISDQLQNYRGDEVEALIVGGDGALVHLYLVDTRGSTHYLNDVGFAAIGSGAWHARSRLMQGGYVNTLPYYPALAAIFTAKKAAEVAPGVGTATDVYLILKDHVEPLRPEVADKLPELFVEYQTQLTKLGTDTIERLGKYIESLGPQTPTEVRTLTRPEEAVTERKSDE